MRWLLALLLATVVGGFLFSVAASIETTRYRLTLVVDVGGKEFVGSGVIEVSAQDTKGFFGNIGGTGSRVRGEAIVVDMANYGKLFALVRGQEPNEPEGVGYPASLIVDAFYDASDRRLTYLQKLRALRHERPKGDLPVSKLPMLVRFRDISNPASVERIEPDKFAIAFGGDAKLKRATVEITEEPISTGIVKILPWLVALRGGYIHGKTSREAPLGLHAGNFQRGT